MSGASSLAKGFSASDLVIGLAVVAFGTSTPELFVNLISAVQGNTDIGIGNVLGSNIANIFLVLGVTAIIYPVAVGKGTIWKEIPLSLLAVIVLVLLANDQLIDAASSSAVTKIDGLVLLCFFAIFLYYSAGIAKPIDGMEDEIAENGFAHSQCMQLEQRSQTGLSFVVFFFSSTQHLLAEGDTNETVV